MDKQPQNMSDGNGRANGRGRLLALCVLAVILAVIATGAYIYQRANSDVREYYATNYACRDSFPAATLQRISFSSQDWISLEFRLPYPQVDPRSPEFRAESTDIDPCWLIAATFERDLKWSLRRFGVASPFSSIPEPVPDYTDPFDSGK